MLALAVLLAVQTHAQPPASEADVTGELIRLRAAVASLEVTLRQRDERLGALGADLATLRSELAARDKERSQPSPAGPFLSGPPDTSDSLGVAKVAVFAPRVRIESAAFHDALSLRVRRVEATALQTVGDAEVGRDGVGTPLPIDVNGALYVVEWSTSEGHSYSLVLLDGASGLPAATVQVRPHQSQGRLVFVGYRVE